MGKPFYSGFTILESSKLRIYETNFENIQPYSGQENIQLLYMDTECFVFSVKTKDIVRDLKNTKYI